MGVEYRPPAISDLGTLQELTLANADGPFTDAAFPENTPKGEVTFS